MDYVVALPITYGLMSSVYQYLKTGKAPEDVQDLLAPRTGGVDANSGKPERLLMPGYMKDVFGFIEHPTQEAANKVGTAPSMVGQTLANKDWRGDPIINPDAPGMDQMAQYLDYLTKSVGPISIRSWLQGQKQGSNISGLETVLGVRTAPRQLIDPEGQRSIMQKIHQRAWKTKLRHDARQKSLYGGTSNAD